MQGGGAWGACTEWEEHGRWGSTRNGRSTWLDLHSCCCVECTLSSALLTLSPHPLHPAGRLPQAVQRTGLPAGWLPTAAVFPGWRRWQDIPALPLLLQVRKGGGWEGAGFPAMTGSCSFAFLSCAAAAHTRPSATSQPLKHPSPPLPPSPPATRPLRTRSGWVTRPAAACPAPPAHTPPAATPLHAWAWPRAQPAWRQRRGAGLRGRQGGQYSRQ